MINIINISEIPFPKEIEGKILNLIKKIFNI